VPETTLIRVPIQKFGSVAASARLWAFVADVQYEAVRLSVAPTTIASGELVVDVLHNGVSMLSTKAKATVADTPVPAVFSRTRIDRGATVVIALTSGSSTVTDVLGLFVFRPLLGSERRE
jgi:hypothetical protein